MTLVDNFLHNGNAGKYSLRLQRCYLAKQFAVNAVFVSFLKQFSSKYFFAVTTNSPILNEFYTRSVFV